MSDGKEMSGMEDKAVSTVDLENFADDYMREETHWNVFTIEKFLTVLINNKIMQMRAMNSMDFDSEKSDSFIEDSKEKEPPDKKRHHHRYHSPHHRHHCQKHSHQEEQQQQRSSISKVQKWSEDLELDLSPEHKHRTEEEISRHEEKKKPKEGYLVIDIESNKIVSQKKRKRKKRKKGAGKKKVSQIDPEDLPKRARWTIIITSGLLILTCMFLVGVTLRMAPVIDQMVRTKNEELMNSLNRNNNPAYYSSVNPQHN